MGPLLLAFVLHKVAQFLHVDDTSCLNMQTRSNTIFRHNKFRDILGGTFHLSLHVEVGSGLSAALSQSKSADTLVTGWNMRRPAVLTSVLFTV